MYSTAISVRRPDRIACATLAQIPILVAEELMAAISAGADEAEK